MKLIQKMILASLVAGITGGVTAIGGSVVCAVQADNLEGEKTDLLVKNGYIQANEQYKQQIIDRLVKDFESGLISEKYFERECQKFKLKELDLDVYAINNLSDENYRQYIYIKENKLNKEDATLMHIFLGFVSAGVFAGVTGVCFSCRKDDESKDELGNNK